MIIVSFSLIAVTETTMGPGPTIIPTPEPTPITSELWVLASYIHRAPPPSLFGMFQSVSLNAGMALGVNEANSYVLITALGL